MGKAAGDDFRDGKVTLPVILAYARGSEDERSFWRSAMAGERASDEDLERAIGLLRGSEALSETLDRARQYGRRALDALAGFPSSKAKAALSEAVEFAISRAY
jgi:octaprenyl-diphosphate synthase